MKKVTMLGAGSWGTALALVLTDNGNEVCVWAHRADLIHQINELHENKDYLPNVKLSTSIKGTTDMKEAVSDADVIIVAVPTKAIREVLRQAVPFITKKAVFVHVSKGIEPDSLLRISEIMEIELPSDVRKDIVVLSTRVMRKK